MVRPRDDHGPVRADPGRAAAPAPVAGRAPRPAPGSASAPGPRHVPRAPGAVRVEPARVRGAPVAAGRGPGPLRRQLVQPPAEPLGQPPGVGEHDRRPVRLDQVEHPLLDVRPDRPPPHRVVLAVGPGRALHVAEVLDRDDDLRVPSAWRWRLHHRHRPRPAQEGRHLRRRPHGGRQPHPLRPPAGGAAQRVQPFERQRQVRAALGARDRVHLVHDDRLDPAQGLPRLRGEQQEERLGGGDEDVGRVRGELAPLVGGGVAGPHRHRDLGLRQPEPARRLPDPGQRRPQVPLDVDRQGLQRRHVDHPAPPVLVRRRRRRRQPVDRPQERGQRLARPGRRDDQRVAPSPPVPARRSPARPAPEPGWARRTRPRTTPASRSRTRPARPRCSPPQPIRPLNPQRPPVPPARQSAPRAPGPSPLPRRLPSHARPTDSRPDPRSSPSVQAPPIWVCPSFVRWRTIAAVLAAGALTGCAATAGRTASVTAQRRLHRRPPGRRPTATAAETEASAQPAPAAEARRAPSRAPERGHPPADANAAEHHRHRVQEPHPRLLARRHHRQPRLRPARVLPREGIPAGQGHGRPGPGLAEPALGRIRPRRRRRPPAGRPGRAADQGHRPHAVRDLGAAGRLLQQHRVLARPRARGSCTSEAASPARSGSRR